MKTVGEILNQARLEKGVTFNQVAKATKIRLSFLKALEDDDYQKLPSGTIARGFVKNYAEYLSLSSKEILAIFRRDFVEKKATSTDSETMTPNPSKKFAWSPKLTTLVGVAFLMIAFIAYLIWQYFSLINAPYY